MPPKKNNKSKNGNGGTLGIENELWEAADKLRGHLDAAEYKSVVLGLIFLKYVSDMFEQVRARVEQEGLDDPEDRDVYLAERVFWVPKEARWKVLQDNAKQESIGNLIDKAMESIERDNPILKGMLPGNYGRATLDKRRLGDLVDMVSNKINFVDEESRKQDTLGRVYEYFLSQFASQEGRKGGEFYTPRSVVRVLVEMLAPYKGRVFDPCCGSGGMFVQSEKFVEAHGGRIGDISVYGQESNPNTFKLAKMNLAIRGIEGDLGKEPAELVPQRPAPRPESGFYPGQPALQHERLGRGGAARGQTLEVRHAAGRQRQLCLGAAFHPPPFAQRHGGIRAGQRQHVEQYLRRRRDPQSHHRSRPGGLHGRPARAVVLQHPNPGVFVVPVAEQERNRKTDEGDVVHRCPQTGDADRPRPP